MAGKRISMTKGKEILRLRIGEGRSLRHVASSVGCSASTVHDVEARFKEKGMAWPLNDATAEQCFLETWCAPKRGKKPDKV